MDEEYRGEATMTVVGLALPVSVHLSGYFEPIDGRYHWFGRVAENPAVTEAAVGRHASVVLATRWGSAPATLGDPDPWHRYRLTGVGRPPFPIGLTAPDPLG